MSYRPYIRCWSYPFGSNRWRCLQSIEDLKLDVPAADDLVAHFIARAVTDDILPPAFLSQLSSGAPALPPFMCHPSGCYRSPRVPPFLSGAINPLMHTASVIRLVLQSSRLHKANEGTSTESQAVPPVTAGSLMCSHLRRKGVTLACCWQSRARPRPRYATRRRPCWGAATRQSASSGAGAARRT